MAGLTKLAVLVTTSPTNFPVRLTAPGAKAAP